MNSYEIKPGASGCGSRCGCDGVCAGEKKAAPIHPLLGRALKGFELLGTTLDNEIRSTGSGRSGHEWWAPFLASGIMPRPDSEYWRRLAEAPVR